MCLTTVRRAEGVAKKEELAVKRTGQGPFPPQAEEIQDPAVAVRMCTHRIESGPGHLCVHGVREEKRS